MDSLERKLQRVLKECETLKEENHKLKEILRLNNITISMKQPQMGSVKSKEQILKERIKIFRSLFKGRTDVFAIRWEYRDGKSGYSPARARKGPNKESYQDRKLFPLTDQVIYDHLIGKKTIGIYPMLQDETCWFLAVDFDKENWQDDATAFMETCKEFSVAASIEISRSGNGCHVWIFFQDAILAKTARKLGNFLLTRTLEKRYQTGIDSYDRLFPNQDTLPKGGFGNLIALPLQHEPREKGNSVFVDEYFNAFPDQWNYLDNIKKITYKEVDNLIRKYYQNQSISIVKNKPETYEEKMPDKINVLNKNGIYIPKSGLPSKLMNQLQQLATFNNPEFYKAQAKRLSTYKLPRKIDCTEEDQDYLILPRGCVKDIKSLFAENKIELTIIEKASSGKEINFEFHGKLRPQQEEAVQSLMKYPCGILSATTGFGKTVVAASLISKRNVNTLVIVHRKQLIDQWKDRLSAFFNIDISEIGQVGGGKNTAKGKVDIATIQSLNHNGVVKDLITQYGQIIVDECHHISAFSFEMVLKKAEARFVYGLTATPTRKDGLHQIMTMQCGPIRFKVSAKNQAKVRPFEHILVPRYTAYKTKVEEGQLDIQNMYSELIKSDKRNDMIFNDVLKELDKGACPIILTERVDHVKEFESRLTGFAKNIIVLTGGMSKKEEQTKLKKLEEIPDKQERLVIATGKYIGEGFDNARLDTMFLAMPISWKGTLQQYVGRLHRLHDDKEVVKVYDYVDHQEPVLKKMFEKRLKGYNSLGYKLKEAGSKTDSAGQQMKLF
ncbi:DEAD/DEAH box helicase [Virgibacillus necropolis]|uniref:TOTE conflict system archaeo-eukaryotic primase domain-containing protein n=1 Tax=Virgibacillus necropolis TaxID=163877 RepID=UPI00384D9829